MRFRMYWYRIQKFGVDIANGFVMTSLHRVIDFRVYDALCVRILPDAPDSKVRASEPETTAGASSLPSTALLAHRLRSTQRSTVPRQWLKDHRRSLRFTPTPPLNNPRLALNLAEAVAWDWT